MRSTTASGEAATLSTQPPNFRILSQDYTKNGHLLVTIYVVCRSKVPLTGLGIPTRAGNLYQTKTVRKVIYTPECFANMYVTTEEP